MSTKLKTIYQNQLQKEIQINYNFKALSPGGIFADRGSQLGLTFNYYGGLFQKSDGNVIEIQDGSIALSDNQVNYVFFNANSNSIEVNITGVVNGNFPIAEITTLNGAIIENGIKDLRVFALYSKGTRSDLAYSLPKATIDILGGIKIGSGLTIAEDGTVSVSSSGSSSLAINYNGALIKSNVSSINFLGSGVSVIDNNGVVDVSITGGGGSTSELTYLNDSRKLRYSWKPQYGGVTTLNIGTFSSTSSALTSPYYSSIATFNKYPIWNKYDVAILNTASTANSNSAIYGTSGNHFKRNGSTRCIVHQLFGCPVNSSTVNSIFVIGVTLSPDSNSGNTIGTNNDFTSIKNSTIGVCWRSTDTNLQIIYFNTSNVLTFIDLGSNFPVPNEDNNIKSAYELIIDDLGTATDVKITVKRLDVNFETSNTINPIGYSVANSYRAFCQLRTLEAVQKSVGVSDMYIYQF